jgi:hypothetical protein
MAFREEKITSADIVNDERGARHQSGKSEQRSVSKNVIKATLGRSNG